MGRWIQFDEQEMPATRKTKVFTVINKEFGTNLGTIAWHAPFRKYSFFPTSNKVFESQCLQDITDFIDDLMHERKVLRLAFPTLTELNASDISEDEAQALREKVTPLIKKVQDELDTIEMIVTKNKHTIARQEQFKKFNKHGN